jgi:aldose 1-epimerase
MPPETPAVFAGTSASMFRNARYRRGREPALQGKFGRPAARITFSAMLVLVAFAQSAAAQPYSAAREGEIVRLRDAKAATSVSILTSVGNIAFEMTVKGQNVLHWPYASIDAFKARPALSGIPFVGPWANRLDEQAFYANGMRYPFDMALGNVRGAIPIHGFLSAASDWRIVEVAADPTAAWVTSVLDVSRQPSWMKQWPFAHTVELTYRLQGGTLEVRTTIANRSAEPMPIAIGFHPFFQLTDSSRNDWTISVGARTHWLLQPDKVPSGETEPIDRLFPPSGDAKLRDYNLDDVFSDLVRDARGRATMTVTGKSQRLDVAVGPRYKAIVIWAPHPENAGRGSQALGAPAASSSRPGPDRNFICFEPMAGVTDALNLAQKGKYRELESVAPGGAWTESFWITPSGF